MGNVFNMVGGGRSLPQYAAISVTYGVGLVCTCSDGVTTLTAPDTSGVALFIVSYAATWTVTDGNESRSVVVSAFGQVKNVNLVENVVFYRGITTLAEFRNWWRYVDGQAQSTITVSGDDFYTFTPPGSNARGWQLINPLNLTNFSILRLYGYRSGTTAIGFNSSNTASTPNVDKDGTLTPNTTNGVYESDISQLYGNYYLGIRGTPSSVMYISKVALL